jgi:hypothetical protein
MPRLPMMAIAVFLFGLVLWKAGDAAMKMSSATASDGQQVSQVRAGETAKFVEKISDASNTGTLTGIILNKKTDDLYVETLTHATVHWDNQTKIVMGKTSDLHPGAVIHITASALQDHTFIAQQLVILTGYIKVQSQ